jgi:hypothetical protein
VVELILNLARNLSMSGRPRIGGIDGLAAAFAVQNEHSGARAAGAGCQLLIERRKMKDEILPVGTKSDVSSGEFTRFAAL